jgi:hypothetical protein
MPTLRGPIVVSLENDEMHPFGLRIEVPASVTAKVGVPARHKQSTTLIFDGKQEAWEREGDFLFLDHIGSGTHVLAYGEREDQ